MGRLLRLFVIVASIAVLVAWLADHPGQLVLDWQGYRIETSFAVLLAIGAGLYGLLRAPFWIHSRWRGARGQLVRHRNGLEALTRGMTAIAAGDAGAANRYAARADRLLAGAPLSLLMQAQAAELRKDELAARNYFQTMLIAPETEFLGLRGLLGQAMRQGDMDYAARLVDRAMRLHPKSPWLIRNKFEIECATGAWPQARETLGRAARTKLITREQRNRRQGILAFAQACQALEQGADAQALGSAQEALKGAPDLIPAAVLSARLLAASGKPDKAARVLEKCWALNPHPDLSETFGSLVPDEKPAQRLIRMRRLIAANPEHLESRLLGAATALAVGETARARELLKSLMGPEAPGDASQRVCILMVQLAQAQGLSAQEAQRWLALAPLAAPDPAWQCRDCGKQSQTWQMLCPSCGAFDSIHWAVPEPSKRADVIAAPGLLAQGASL
ncbi:MAG: heme biosynthesis HemY N-terminal domain-containing protein [Alphaproteobacteria bacterium]